MQTSSTFGNESNVDKKRRLEFLLKQTEIFAHFMSNGRIRNDENQSKNNQSKKSKRHQKKR